MLGLFLCRCCEIQSWFIMRRHNAERCVTKSLGRQDPLYLGLGYFRYESLSVLTTSGSVIQLTVIFNGRKEIPSGFQTRHLCCIHRV